MPMMAKASKPKRVGPYLRVSTSEQTTRNQQRELREVADRHGWDVVAVFEDAGISGSKGREAPPGFDALMKAVARRKIDMTAVASSGGKRRRRAMWGQENRRRGTERQKSGRSERLLRCARAQSGFVHPVGMALISATARTWAGCWRRSRMAGSKVASNKTLNAKNFAALGAARLAELLIEVSTGNAAAKRRLRLELAGAQSPGEVAKEVRKRLTAIARSHSFIDWQNRKALVADLETQRRAIVDQVAKSDPAEALELLWRFTTLANSVFARCDDSSGTVIGIFHAACRDLGEIAEVAKAAPATLAERAFNALNENDYGQYDHLIEVLSPALGSTGLEQLKERFLELAKAPIERPKDKDRKLIGWGTGGPLYADESAARRRESTIRLALQGIADAQGDVDAFIAQQSEKAKTVPRVAAEIARRLLGEGRANEAWSAINAADENRPGWIPFEWEEVRLEVMEALGRQVDAQAFRWQCFGRTLNSDHLRAYLKRMPDFEEIEAEERAMSYALGFPNIHQALAFLILWPALDKATKLVVQRASELNGDHYEILTPAADALAEKHPLASTILLRAMIDFSLENGRATRYRHAARHLSTCADISAAIPHFGAFETHDAYVGRLKAKHGRKSAFWDAANSNSGSGGRR